MNKKGNSKKYHYFYKITNIINGHYYYGVHNTDNIDDGYMGSGVRLRLAYKKYGIENFTKEILKYFDTSDEAFTYESNIVTENLVKDIECYNCELGGINVDTTGFAVVKNSIGEHFLVDINDENYKNGKYVGVTKGLVSAKDNNGNIFIVSVNDERLKNGSLKYIWQGRKHKQETINKIKQTLKEKKIHVGKNNSQYGTRWINKNGINKKIKQEDLNQFLSEGWKIGRIINSDIRKKMNKARIYLGSPNTVWVSNINDKKSKRIKKQDLQIYLNDGWIIGRKFVKKKVTKEKGN